MIVKKHNNSGKLVLAVSDSSLFGMKISEGEKQLDLSCEFYNGEETSKEEIISLMKESHIINLVGSESLAIAREIVNVNDEDIIFVDKVPHAQVLFMAKEV
ncbi:MAG: DUF424 family protein [Nanobdellota archaeon]